MTAARRYAFDVALLAIAIALYVAPFPPGWIENAYANGLYARLATTFVPLVNRLPIACGDVLLGAIVAAFVAGWIRGWLAPRRSRGARLTTIVMHSAGALAAIAIWFDASWALNYRRVPVVSRVAFDPARVTPATVATFSANVIAQLDATAPLAHARSDSEAEMETALARAFGPVVQRLGDRYPVAVSRPKVSLFNWWFALAGIGGMWDPFAYETLVNADFLPFERPFAVAHEWGHVAGFGDESDANLIAALTTLRSNDPAIRYSGLFWAYGFLPDAERRKFPVSPLVAGDLAAARARFLQHYDPQLFALQWFVYDKYLRANRVAAGVASYSLFVEVLAGTPLDRAGLPLMRPARAAGSAAGSAR